MKQSLAFLKEKGRQPPLDQVRFHREIVLSTPTVCLTLSHILYGSNLLTSCQLEHDRKTKKTTHSLHISTVKISLF